MGLGAAKRLHSQTQRDPEAREDLLFAPFHTLQPIRAHSYRDRVRALYRSGSEFKVTTWVKTPIPGPAPLSPGLCLGRSREQLPPSRWSRAAEGGRAGAHEREAETEGRLHTTGWKLSPLSPQPKTHLWFQGAATQPGKVQMAHRSPVPHLEVSPGLLRHLPLPISIWLLRKEGLAERGQKPQLRGSAPSLSARS